MTFSLIGSTVYVITTVLAVVGLPGLFALMAVESFGIPPIPSEVIIPFAGFLVADGTLALDPTIVASVTGGLVGAYIAYAVGRWWRSRLVGLGVGRLRISDRDIARMDRWFRARGEVTVAICRVIPGIRSYISYPAGTARMNPVRFGVYSLVGSLPWTLALLYAGIVLGSNWNVVSHYFFPIDVTIVVLVVVAGVYLALVATGDLTGGWPPRRGPGRSKTPAPDVPAPERPAPRAP
jgi:membrane protein DedA with SNARE-associated domain